MMKALRFEDNRLQVAETGKPKRADEAIIRVTRSGICNTDLEIVRGYAGFQGTMGHEFVGVVEKADAAPEWVGKRVVGEINAGCGVCELCRAGDSRHCPDRTVMGIVGRDGCHAEYVSLPVVNLLEVPPNVPDEQAVFVEPLAAAYGILEQIEIRPETRVAIVGDGKLGLLCALSLNLKSENVFLIGKHREKMKIVENAGIEGIMLDSAPKLNSSFDVTVESSGSESGFATTLDLLKPRGKLVLKSTFSGKPTWEAWRIVVDEITIVGSRCGRFAPAIELLAKRKINVESFISDEYALESGIEAMERAAEKSVLKVLLKP